MLDVGGVFVHVYNRIPDNTEDAAVTGVGFVDALIAALDTSCPYYFSCTVSGTYTRAEYDDILGIWTALNTVVARVVEGQEAGHCGGGAGTWPTDSIVRMVQVVGRYLLPKVAEPVLRLCVRALQVVCTQQCAMIKMEDPEIVWPLLGLMHTLPAALPTTSSLFQLLTALARSSSRRHAELLRNCGVLPLALKRIEMRRAVSLGPDDISGAAVALVRAVCEADTETLAYTSDLLTAGFAWHLRARPDDMMDFFRTDHRDAMNARVWDNSARERLGSFLDAEIARHIAPLLNPSTRATVATKVWKAEAQQRVRNLHAAVIITESLHAEAAAVMITAAAAAVAAAAAAEVAVAAEAAAAPAGVGAAVAAAAAVGSHILGEGSAAAAAAAVVDPVVIGRDSLEAGPGAGAEVVPGQRVLAMGGVIEPAVGPGAAGPPPPPPPPRVDEPRSSKNKAGAGAAAGDGGKQDDDNDMAAAAPAVCRYCCSYITLTHCRVAASCHIVAPV